VQREVRYVDIGSASALRPAARDVFLNRYGDCKDKVTLLSTMLREAGIESYYVLANVDRGAVAADFSLHAELQPRHIGHSPAGGDHNHHSVCGARPARPGPFVV
jgi:hypothetical protein